MEALTIDEEAQVVEAIRHFSLRYGGQQNAPETIRVPIMPRLGIMDYSDSVPLPLTASYKVVELTGRNGYYQCDLLSKKIMFASY